MYKFATVPNQKPRSAKVKIRHLSFYTEIIEIEFFIRTELHTMHNGTLLQNKVLY